MTTSKSTVRLADPPGREIISNADSDEFLVFSHKMSNICITLQFLNKLKPCAVDFSGVKARQSHPAHGANDWLPGDV